MINKKTKTSGSTGLFKSTAVVAGMTLLSRVLGFVRDLVLAMSFGAGPAFDAFIIAFKLPNFLRRLFAEGAFSQAFVPVLSEYRLERDKQDVQSFVDRIAGMLGLVLTLVVLIAEMVVPAIVLVSAPGFADDPLRYAYAIRMLHITLPYLLLISLAAFVGAILNTYSRFAIAALSPVVLNIVLITVAWFWAPYTATPIYTLAWGVLFGGVLQLCLQLPFLKRIHLLPIPRLNFKDRGVRRVLKLMLPALFGVSVAQISLLIDSFFASFLRAGSISWLYYSDRLIYLPQGVIGIALTTVILPYLSQHYAKKDSAAYGHTLDWALRSALLVGVPSALGLAFLARPILSILMGHGAFTDFDVIMTAKSLAALAVGLPAFMCVKIFASAFYSRQDIKTPVKIAAVSVLINIILSILLIKPLAHAGLALATAMTAIVNAMGLFIILYRRKIFRLSAGWAVLLLRLLFANAIIGALTYYFSAQITSWWMLVIIMIISVICYAAALWLSGLRMRHIRPMVGLVSEVSCS